MKKVFLFALIALYSLDICAQAVQTSIPDFKSQLQKFSQSSKSRKIFDGNIKNRAFTESYFLNYVDVEQSISTDNNFDALYVTFMKLNNYFDKTQFGVLSDLYQYVGKNGSIYDVYGFDQANSKYVFNTIDISKTAMKLDSFNLKVKHNRVSNLKNDTLIVSIYDNSQVTIPTSVVTGTYPNWTSTRVTYGAKLYSDTLVLSSQLAYNDTIPFSSNPFYFTNKTYKPNLTLPAGKAFGLRVEFRGDTQNYITPLFTSRDECSATCLESPAYIKNTTGFLFLPFNKGTANEINYSGTLNAQGVWFFCKNNEPCEYWYPQNWDVDYYVTSLTQFNINIDPISSYVGCSGDSKVLAGSYSGLDTTKTVSMLWKAVGGGIFENGKDTITGPTATYTYDTLGGFKMVILKGTATNGEIAYDTVSFTNFTMKPIVTKTGLISCNTKDSIRLNINGSAAVGISSTIVTYYDGQTSLNLAASQNDLNSYFGIKYSWSSAGNSSRNDTSFIYTKTPGTYTVTVTNFAGCSATNQTIITGTSSVPTLNFNVSPTTICQNKPVTFTNASSKTTGWNFTWKDGTTTLSTDPTSFTNTFTSAGTKTIVLSADTTNCPSLTPTPVSKSITILASTDAKCKSSISSINIENNVSIFPNPTSNGKFTVESKINSNLDIVITDLLGKVIYAGTVNKLSKKDISLESAKGIYMMTIGNDSEKIIKKLMVERD